MRSPCRILVFVLSALFALLGACARETPFADVPLIDTPPPRLSEAEGEPWAIAVIASDYAVSAVSILDRASGALYAERVYDSSVAADGLSAALSGDVVLPSAPNALNRLVLIDRYPNAALTILDPRSFAPRLQVSVGTGFAANPHDFLLVSAEKAYVTRYNANVHPGREAFDAGDDILILNPTNGALLGRIGLPAPGVSASGAALRWRPDRLLRVGAFVYVSLAHLAEDFREAGDAALARLDPERDALLDIVTFPGLANGGGMAYDAESDTLYLAASGVFAEGGARQAERSAIVALSFASGATPEWRILRRASDDGAGRPFGAELEVWRATVIALRLGDLAAKRPDLVVAIDASGAESVLHTSATPYGAGGLLVDPGTESLYVGDADAAGPRIWRFAYVEGGFVPKGGYLSSPHLGLPPRHLRLY